MASTTGFAGSPIVLLTTLSILLAAALVRGLPASRRSSTRWASASAALLGLVAVWLVAEQIPSLQGFLPALERVFGVMLAALAVWAAMRTAPGLLDWLVSGALAITALLFLIGVAFPPDPPFGASRLDLGWTLLTLLVSGTGLASLLAVRPAAWAAFAAVLAVLALGQIGHALTPPAFDAEATSLSIAHAVATPIFAIGGIIRLISSREAAAAPASSPAAPGSWAGLRALTGLAVAEDPDAFATALIEAVGTATGAEICLLLAPPGPDGIIRIGAAFDFAESSLLPPSTLGAASAPVIAQAMALGRSAVLPARSHAPDIGSVLRAIGKTGRLAGVLIPLRSREVSVAAMLLLSSPDRPGWGDDLRLALDQQAPAWGGQLDQLMAAARSRAPQPGLALALDSARDRIAELEARLEARPEPASDLVGLDDLRRQLDESQQAIEVLEAETRRLRQAPASRPPGRSIDAARLQAEFALALQALAEARAAVTAEAPDVPPGSPPSARVIASLQAARQPLTAIGGYTDLLLGESVGLLGSSQRLFLQRIRSAVRRMNSELGGLTRALSRAAGPSQAATVDVGPALEQALEGLHGRLREKSLGLRLDLPARPTSVIGDARTVQDLFDRLLTIAADQAPPGREIVVSLLADSGEDVLVITSSDHGPAVGAADFEGLHDGTAKEVLPGREPPGLARVRRLVEMLAGRVWIERRPEGTTISVLLPAAP